MTATIFEALLILFTFITLLWVFAWRTKINITGELLLGILFGIIWELLTLNFWNYDMPLVLFSDVSLLIIMGWGVVFVLSFNTAQFLEKRFKSDSFIIPDLISSLWGIVFEWFGFVFYKMWNYNSAFPGGGFFGLPWRVVFAWPFVVLLYNNFIRNYDKIIESRLAGKAPPPSSKTSKKK